MSAMQCHNVWEPEVLRLKTRCDTTDQQAVLTVVVDVRAPYRGLVTCSACGVPWKTNQVALMRDMEPASD